jgi:hypothetical protein
MRVCAHRHPETERYCEMRHGHRGPHQYAIQTVTYVHWDASDESNETKES